MKIEINQEQLEIILDALSYYDADNVQVLYLGAADDKFKLAAETYQHMGQYIGEE